MRKEVHYMETRLRVIEVSFVYDSPRPGMAWMDLEVVRGPDFTPKEWTKLARIMLKDERDRAKAEGRKPRCTGVSFFKEPKR